MPATVDSIYAAIEQATAPGFRGRLLAQGQARAMVWRDGVLPDDSPRFSERLSYDLQSYGYSLLTMGLRLRELGGDPSQARKAFEQAGLALEAVVSRGPRDDTSRDFHFVIAAAAYHLAHLSAQAYSLLALVRNDDNFSPIEKALTALMLRDLSELERMVLGARTNGSLSDAQILANLETRWSQLADSADGFEDDDLLFHDSLDSALTDNFFGAISSFLLALERGEGELVQQAVAQLREGLKVCEDLAFVPQRWSHKIAIHLLTDLWDSSFHVRLPLQPSGDDAIEWQRLRNLFICVMLRKGKAQIELWPSQIAAATRAVDQADDLVVSLPTSAGKTRIAELCILRCLAAGKRIVFVTPLRALSAQTEATLQDTFGPLGVAVSALYGSIGVSDFDEDVIRERKIVVTTPEKLDFAIRNDPTLLDDVGLLIFDEGHMIGLSEREVRYEVQIQRLLKRPDAQGRRIVCLSAILPDGNQLEDFANWLRRDQPGGLIKSDWRPTRLRYGEIIWNARNGTARLTLRVGDERPFVPRFLTGVVPPIGRRTKSFPKDLGELCVASAWKLIEDGHSALVFCPVRAHVEPFADRIVDLFDRGAITSLLTVDESVLRTALTLGAEWLGPNHPILKCLKIGAAIHHGALPTAYRKEIERLLRDGVLKLTISSPTLAQGLNLSATVVIIHSLYRNRDRIEAAEFKNVVGRAGRAFVDIEGLVLYPIFDEAPRRLQQWEHLIADATSREMESGLVRLLVTLLHRLNEALGNPSTTQLIDYVMNNANAWEFPHLASETPEQAQRSSQNWDGYLATLDTAILSLIGENDVPDEALPTAIDEILRSSLWERRLNRRSEEAQTALKAGLVARARHIWARSNPVLRKGYFLAGIGLDTGHALDAAAAELNELLVDANAAIAGDNSDLAITIITRIAELVFTISPFVPEKQPDNWREILRLWLSGLPLSTETQSDPASALHFVESGIVYRLPWAMEAIRVRGVANSDLVGDTGFRLDDFDLTRAIPAIETGTLNRSASLLIQAGFNSRLAAIKAVTDAGGNFTNIHELREWLSSEAILAWTARPDWPTTESKDLWNSFVQRFAPTPTSVWKEQPFWAPATWSNAEQPPAGSPVQLFNSDHRVLILAPDGTPLGSSAMPLNPERRGLLRAEVKDEPGKLILTYFGPEDLWVTRRTPAAGAATA